ncbi:response regulator [Microvirga sp. M2]|uniref:response regulator n=1 Tax=Microvirga sp. M2 TaxID=3073270 RepID=UPI0039C38ABE
MKVLVIEDDPFVREMAVTQLEEAGFEVIEAADGGQALRLLQTGMTVDALLTEVQMPEVNGWEVAKAYRERFPALPVIYVTSYVEQMQPVPGGVIVSKPYKLSLVIGLLRPRVRTD